MYLPGILAIDCQKAGRALLLMMKPACIRLSNSKKDAEAYIRWINKKQAQISACLPKPNGSRAPRQVSMVVFIPGQYVDPWRCNTAESVKRGTTPVDFYAPGGESPSGVTDMVGNVWEWTSSVFSPYPYRSNDGREEHKLNVRYVIRGGAWYYTRKLARCAAREGMLEDYLLTKRDFVWQVIWMNPKRKRKLHIPIDIRVILP